MEVGTKVWVKSDTEVWAPAIVKESFYGSNKIQGNIVVQTEEGYEKSIKFSSNQLNQNDAEILVQNEIKDFHGLSCLIGLKHLHEPAILHVLHERFYLSRIYTYIGEILLATNPFQKLDLYSKKQIELYKNAMLQEEIGEKQRHIFLTDQNKNKKKKLQPHVFEIAGRAYCGLKRRQKSQSILVSGESGSGKTETTKFVMLFLTSVVKNQTNHPSHLSSTQIDIGKRILQTNPILESFGNARTMHNDNSSRFGKFIKIQFGKQNEIIGAEMESYLLEKVRLIHQTKEERNFHIFYELIEGADNNLRQKLGFDLIQEKKITNQSFSILNYPKDNKTQLIKKYYAKRFQQTIQAMEDTGISSVEKNFIFEILAALLHLGELTFICYKEEKKKEKELTVNLSKNSLIHLQKSAQLLGINSKFLQQIFLTRKIKAGIDIVEVQLNENQAKDASHSIAKMIYGRLFKWLVEKLSDSMKYSSSSNSNCHEDIDVENIHTIGILDIFGFENVGFNGFEQFCINYANEKLQAQFNEFVFEREQEIYMKEQIEWRSIPFPSNLNCLMLFDQKEKGLFSLLDQEGIIPGGNNSGLVNKIYQYHCQKEEVEEELHHLHHQKQLQQQQQQRPPLSSSSSTSSTTTKTISASKIHKARKEFMIHHFAGQVCYAIEEFLEKNVDTLPAEASKVLKESTNHLVAKIGAEDNHQASGGSSFLKRSSSNLTRKSPPTNVRSRSLGTLNATNRSFGVLRTPSVSSQFRNQLDVLLDQISLTDAHYIRCIKSNDEKKSDLFTRSRVVEQLRSVGVLEAVRIARAGYSIRMIHKEFVDLFFPFRQFLGHQAQELQKNTPRIQAILLSSALLSEKAKTEGQKIRKKSIGELVDKFNKEVQEDGLQVGKTMVFCKRQVFNVFNQLRSEMRYHGVVIVQKNFRGFQGRQRYQRIKKSIISLQAIVRSKIIRSKIQRVLQVRKKYAILKIQRQWNVKKESLILKKRFSSSSSSFKNNSSSSSSSREQNDFGSSKELIMEVYSLKEKKHLDSRLLTSVATEPVDSPPISGCSSFRAPPLSSTSTINEELEKEKTRLEQQNAELQREILRLQQLLIQGKSLTPVAPTKSHYAERAEAEAEEEEEVEVEVEPELEQEEQIENDENIWAEQEDNESPPTSSGSNVAILSRKIEELDAKCRFLEQLVVTTADPEARNSAASSTGYYPPAFASAHSHSGNSTPRQMRHSYSGKSRHGSASMTATPFCYGTAGQAEPESEFEGLLRSLQRHVENLRESWMNADMSFFRKESHSFSSSNPTRSSMSTFSYAGSHDEPRYFSPRYPQHQQNLSYLEEEEAADDHLSSSYSSSSATGTYVGPRMRRIVKWACSSYCYQCSEPFTLFLRRHHCRMCGNSYCDDHSSRKVTLLGIGFDGEPQRVCDACFIDYYATQTTYEIPTSHRHSSYYDARAPMTFFS